MLLTVATIGAPHGLRGEVRLDVRTDEPETRLAPGAVLETDPPDAGPLTILRTRVAPNGFYATFAQAEDRTQAESLRGVRLVVESDEEDADPDGWYAHELTGLRVRHVDGRELGEVTGVEVLPGHDLLVVAEPGGAIARVPFVEAIVLDVDVATGVVQVDPPRGLFAADPPDGVDDAGDEPGADPAEPGGVPDEPDER